MWDSVGYAHKFQLNVPLNWGYFSAWFVFKIAHDHGSIFFFLVFSIRGGGAGGTFFVARGFFFILVDFIIFKPNYAEIKVLLSVSRIYIMTSPFHQENFPRNFENLSNMSKLYFWWAHLEKLFPQSSAHVGKILGKLGKYTLLPRHKTHNFKDAHKSILECNHSQNCIKCLM